MIAIRYNPLTYSEKLKTSGMNDETARVIAQEQAEIISNILNNEIANKNDIQQVLTAINQMQAEIKSLEYKILIKLGGLMITLIGVLGFILKH